VLLALLALGVPAAASATPAGGPSADLGVYMTSYRVGIGPSHTFRVGEQTAFEIDIVNSGSDPAAKVVLVDTLPTGFRLASVATGLGKTRPKPFFSCAVAPGEVTCSLKAPVPVGSKSLYVLGSFGPKGLGLQTNAAVVSSATHDPAGDNNKATAPVEVVKR
jgi:uncharacterized repeat protein (TIGR01451 family)